MNAPRINAWWEKVLAVNPELDAPAQEKSRLLAGLLFLIISAGSLSLLAGGYFIGASSQIVLGWGVMSALGALYLFNRYGYFTTAAVGALVLSVSATVGFAWQTAGNDPLLFIYLLAPIFIAFIFFEMRRALLFAGGLLLALMITLFAIPSPLNLDTRVNILTIMVILPGMMAAFITYMRRMEGSRLVKQSVLEESNKELEQFAYVASHDLKSPLRGISHLAQWLEEELNTVVTPEQQRYFQLLHGRVQRMEALVEGLRLYYTPARATDRPLDKINVRTLAQDVAKKVNPPPQMRIAFEIEAGAAELTANQSQLEQVLFQLVDNAVRHHDKETGGILISARERENFYQFSVSDDGPGIDPRYHEKAFTIFQTLQARDQLESVGIGLPLIKKLIEANGGAIWLESAVGQGSTFFFTWPK